MKNKRIINIILPLALIVLIASCAKQIAITGGPKDTTPPTFIKSFPPNGSTNMISDRIYVEFDEYIKLNSLNQKLIISPPLEKTPEILIKGKGVAIKLDKAILQANTTYSFNFNDAIADNNENNSLHSFVYAFSTGNQIDSLSFSGSVKDAFSKEVVGDAWVMLYDNLSDTAVYTMQPSYITKTDKEGRFLIPFVKEAKFKIYAVKDNNYNYIFDLPDEGIAFIDTVYSPAIDKSMLSDSIDLAIKNYPTDIELLMFTEQKQAQYIKSYKRPDSRTLQIIFNSTQHNQFDVEVENDPDAIVFSKENPDTLIVYLRSEEIINSNLVYSTCSYTDPIYTDTVRNDSLTFRRPEKSIVDSVCNITVSPIKEPHKNLTLKIQYPIRDFNPEKMKLELKSDTIFIPSDFSILKDSINPMQLIIIGSILEKTDYRIIVEEGFIQDIYSSNNITDTLMFSSSSSSEYANFNIILSDPEKHYIIQLIQNEKVIYESYSSNGNANFEYLMPGKYIVKAIEDANNNKRWDTGDLKIKKQAEKVIFMPIEYEIRSNWNHEIEWNPITNKSK